MITINPELTGNWVLFFIASNNGDSFQMNFETEEEALSYKATLEPVCSFIEVVKKQS